MNYPPILILAYNRPDQLKQVLDSVLVCDNSMEHEIFIHLDGPNVYQTDDLDKCAETNAVAKKYASKYKITLWEEKLHRGLANSVIDSVNRVFERSDDIIVIEDDICLSNDAIVYLSDALNYYKDDRSVWSVTAWAPQLKELKHYSKDVFKTRRACSWSWGTWKDRWSEIDWDVKDFDVFHRDYKRQLAFCKGGYDLPRMLMDQVYGKIDSWAIRWCYAQFVQGMYTIYPRESRANHMQTTSATHVHEQVEQSELLSFGAPYSFERTPQLTEPKDFKLYYKWNYTKWLDFFRNNTRRYDKNLASSVVLQYWLMLNLDGKCLGLYFANRGYRKIGIYGKGRIGKQLEKELSREKTIESIYFIDQNIRLRDGVNCYCLEDRLPKSDCVIITALEEPYKIKERLASMVDCDLKTLLEVLRDQ